MIKEENDVFSIMDMTLSLPSIEMGFVNRGRF